MSVHGGGLLEGLVNQGLFSLGKQTGQSEHAEMLLKIDIPTCLGQRRWAAKQVSFPFGDAALSSKAVFSC